MSLLNVKSCKIGVHADEPVLFKVLEIVWTEVLRDWMSKNFNV